MKAYYFENNAYNGILLTMDDGRWIMYDEVIDGVDIKRENMHQIYRNFKKADYNDQDFEELEAMQLGTLTYGDNCEQVLAEQDYTHMLYEPGRASKYDWLTYEETGERIPYLRDSSEISSMADNINRNPHLSGEQKRLLLDYLRHQAQTVVDSLLQTIKVMGYDIEAYEEGRKH